VCNRKISMEHGKMIADEPVIAPEVSDEPLISHSAQLPH
jgi:lipopolysaccharide transport system ATP-binding protein